MSMEWRSGSPISTVEFIAERTGRSLRDESTSRNRMAGNGHWESRRMEDKIVQQAVATVLNQIYEEDFLGFSYGFRPGRGAHDALDALTAAIMTKKVSWILDADIRGFFDNISHEKLIGLMEVRIADQRIIRLMQKWLKAGVSEDGQWSETKIGTPQGAVISPLLANIYLHYVLDRWAVEWRRKNAFGDMIIVRYADDFVLGFQYRKETERFLEQLRKRLADYGLELHSDKTRLIQFGRFAAEDRKREGKGKPETRSTKVASSRCIAKRQASG
jgi:RNA-directed DNA polymerase